MKKFIAVALLAVPFTFAAQAPAESNAPAAEKTGKVAHKHKKQGKKAAKAATPATPAQPATK